MPTTSKGLRYPASNAAPNGPQQIQDLATDVNTALPGNWTDLSLSTGGYLSSVVADGTWRTLTGLSVTSPTVPPNRTLDIEFKAPAAAVTGGIMYLRLLVNSVQMDTNVFNNVWGNPRLTASILNGATAGTAAIVVQGQLNAGTGDVRDAGGGFVRLRCRIV